MKNILQTVHLYLVIVLVVVVPLIYTYSIKSHQAIPQVAEIPVSLLDEDFAKIQGRANFHLVSTENLYVGFKKLSYKRNHVFALRSKKFYEAPDILIYWVKNELKDRFKDGDFSSAVYLGRVSGKENRVYESETILYPETGSLYLYSFPKNKVVDQVDLSKFEVGKWEYQ